MKKIFDSLSKTDEEEEVVKTIKNLEKEEKEEKPRYEFTYDNLDKSKNFVAVVNNKTIILSKEENQLNKSEKPQFLMKNNYLEKEIPENYKKIIKNMKNCNDNLTSGPRTIIIMFEEYSNSYKLSNKDEIQIFENVQFFYIKKKKVKKIYLSKGYQVCGLLIFPNLNKKYEEIKYEERLENIQKICENSNWIDLDENYSQIYQIDNLAQDLNNLFFYIKNIIPIEYSNLFLVFILFNDFKSIESLKNLNQNIEIFNL
jgi:hypothetical protein